MPNRESHRQGASGGRRRAPVGRSPARRNGSDREPTAPWRPCGKPQPLAATARRIQAASASRSP
jgi:hypothetical protein